VRFSRKNLWRRLYRKAIEEDVFSRAAAVAFYFSFAFFPLLLFLISLFGLVLDNASELRNELFSYLGQIMPESAFDLAQQTIFEVIAGSSKVKLTIGIVVTLWAASAGMDNLRVALNAVYDLKETRSRWRTLLLSILLTICVCLLISVALGLIFYSSHTIEWLLPYEASLLQKLLSWLIVVIALLAAFFILYSILPDHRERAWRWITPGSVTGVCLWLILSLAFQFYLSFVGNYSGTYGSLGAMIILMLWLYLTALVILIGGIVNVIFDDFAKIKK
jgi:membrane protein